MVDQLTEYIRLQASYALLSLVPASSARSVTTRLARTGGVLWQRGSMTSIIFGGRLGFKLGRSCASSLFM